LTGFRRRAICASPETIQNTQRLAMGFDVFRRICLALALASAPSFASAGEPAWVEAEVDRFAEVFSPTGLAVVVIEAGEVSYIGARGVRRAGRAAPVTADTGFTIASMGKAFIAAALASLVDDGKLAWDDPVQKHLPEFRASDPFISDRLTIRDLLTHRSGLALGAGDLLTWPDGAATPGEAVAAVAHLPFEPFRDRFIYSNTMYRVAGAVIERLSGRPWHVFVKERLLAPLGMSGCSPDPRAADRRRLATQHARDLASGRAAPLDGLIEHPDPAGGMVCTIRDLARWALFQLSDGATPEGARILSAERMREMHQGVTPRRLPGMQRRLAGSNLGLYALGWEVADFHGGLLLEHGGQSSGGLSHIALLPGRRAAVAAVANDTGAPVAALSHHLLARIAAGENAADWIGDLARRLPEMRAAAAAAAPAQSPLCEAARKAAAVRLADYAGVYRDPWYGDIRVRIEGGALRIHLTRLRLLNGPLVAVEGDRFIACWPDRSLNADAIVEFSRDAAGRVSGMSLKAASPDTDFSYDYHNLKPVRAD
jgi:CubicO group peptidase (beta-lactamase class C family)